MVKKSIIKVLKCELNHVHQQIFTHCCLNILDSLTDIYNRHYTTPTSIYHKLDDLSHITLYKWIKQSLNNPSILSLRLSS